MRRGAGLAVALAAVVTLIVPVADAGRLARRHRLALPPPILPTGIAVDEGEYYMRPSEPVVAAGTVTIHAYNRGMDDHDVQLRDSRGVVHTVPLHAGQSSTFTAALKPGTYRVICSLFAGTPQSHEALGMHFELTVQ